MTQFLVEHRAEWSSQFEVERRAVVDAAGGDVSDVVHIGSTAIPGMPAKPILDMLGLVTDLVVARAAAPCLAPLGYELRPHRVDAVLYVKRAAGGDTHHLHLTPGDSSLYRERVTFRDALRRDAALAAEYRALKTRLLADSAGIGYTGADKREFVRRVLAASGVDLLDGVHLGAQ